jgi:hypothetical protein
MEHPCQETQDPISKKLDNIIKVNYYIIKMETEKEKGKEMETEKELQERYLKSLTEKERMGYQIAKSHLGLSFQLEKSNGYLEWKNKNGL